MCSCSVCVSLLLARLNRKTCAAFGCIWCREARARQRSTPQSQQAEVAGSCLGRSRHLAGENETCRASVSLRPSRNAAILKAPRCGEGDLSRQGSAHRRRFRTGRPSPHPNDSSRSRFDPARRAQGVCDRHACGELLPESGRRDDGQSCNQGTVADEDL
jgi:hypothetical protein